MSTLILGLGNPILRDDGVGYHVAASLQSKIRHSDVTITKSSASGLSLLEALTGFDRAIIIDAIQTKSGKTGQIYRLNIDDFDAAHPVTIPHNVSLISTLRLGNVLAMDIPRDIIIYAVEVKDTRTFNENCTPEVESVIPVCVRKIIEELNYPEIAEDLCLNSN